MNRTPLHDVDRISCELIERYRAGDQTAFDELAKLHAPLIKHILRASAGAQHAGNLHWREDLRQEALIALARAVRVGGYNSERVSFGTYLHTCVSNRIARYTIQYESLIRVPPNYKNDKLRRQSLRVRKIAKAKGLGGINNPEPMQVTLDNLSASTDTLEAVMYRDEMAQQSTLVAHAMKTLNYRKRDIVYRVANDESFKCIGDAYGISSARVRQIYKVAITQLQRSISNQGHTVNPDLEKRAKYKRQWLRESRERAQQTMALRLKPLTVKLAAQRSKEA